MWKRNEVFGSFYGQRIFRFSVIAQFSHHRLYNLLNSTENLDIISVYEAYVLFHILDIVWIENESFYNVTTQFFLNFSRIPSKVKRTFVRKTIKWTR